MKYEVIVSYKAKEQIALHVAFLAKVKKESARKVKSRLINALNSLFEMPERHPFFDENLIPKNKYHKMYVENWYLILYQIRDNKVYVDYIIDCRQDYGWLIKS